MGIGGGGSRGGRPIPAIVIPLGSGDHPGSPLLLAFAILHTLRVGTGTKRTAMEGRACGSKVASAPCVLTSSMACMKQVYPNRARAETGEEIDLIHILLK